jgi:hypothetical protein
MQSPVVPIPSRRSSRVAMSARMLITSLQRDAQFSEVCETLVVNAHGCALRSPIKLEAGLPLQFHTNDGRQTTGRVVDCQPLASAEGSWQVAARLDTPGNFWGLKTCPDDWASPKLASAAAAPSPYEAARPTQSQAAARVVLTKEHLRSMVADFIQPLAAELTQLKEQLAEPRRSRFEVSLSQIPPELQEQLWVRLRKALGAQIETDIRSQSELVLNRAQTSIAEKLTAAQQDFQQHVSGELRQVEQQAREMSENVVATMRQHLRAGTGAFQQQVSEAETHLAQKNAELIEALQQRLAQDNEAYAEKVRGIQAGIHAQSSRLQAQVAELGSRVAQLDESARRLESDLQARLTSLAGDIVSRAHAELENAVEVAASELATRNAGQLVDQLDDAVARLKLIQKAAEASVSDSLRKQVLETIESFEQTIEEHAQHSVEYWRQALARDLNSLGRVLGEPLHPQSPDRLS